MYLDGCWITFLRDQGEGLIAFWLQFRLVLFACLFALCLLRDMKRKLPVEFDEKDQRKFDYAVHVCEWDPFAVPDSAATEVVAVSLLSRAVSYVACFSFEAIDWIACRDAEEIRRDREARFSLGACGCARSIACAVLSTGNDRGCRKGRPEDERKSIGK